MNFTQTLTDWYSINKREMPWRMTKDPYRIWLSEVILQQTQIKQGLPYFIAFLDSFPTVFDLAQAKESEVLKQWQGLGYYSRARNLHKTARYIAEDLNGKFPDNYKDLLHLKGVGDYTASAIASICFNEATAVVDGNVYRVIARYFGVPTPINSTKGIKEFKAIAQEFIDKNNPGDYNQAIMEFGAIQCKPKSPDCEICPLQSSCVAFNEHTIDLLPVKLNRLKVKKKYFNYIVCLSEDRKTILQQRKGKGIWQNLFQFPLIESSKSLSYKELINNKEFSTILNDEQQETQLYNQNDIVHKLSHQHLYTKFWIVNVKKIHGEAIQTKNLKTYPVPILISNFIEAFSF